MVGTPELSVVLCRSSSWSALLSCRSFFGLSVVFGTPELSVVFGVVGRLHGRHSSVLSVVLWVVGRPRTYQLSSELSVVFWVVGCPLSFRLSCWLSSELLAVLWVVLKPQMIYGLSAAKSAQRANNYA